MSNTLAPQTLRCGWAVADITPPGKMPLEGQFFERIPTHTLDPLQATVMALEAEDGGQCIWVSLDLCAIEAPLTEALAKRLETAIPGFDGTRLILNATHIHTGPYLSATSLSQSWGPLYVLETPPGCLTPEEYVDGFLLPTLEKACVSAWERRIPAGVAPVLGHAAVGYNRRVVYFDGSARMYGDTRTINFDHLEGASDPGLEMLYVFDETRALTGVVVNMACPAQVLENQCYYTADIWGALRAQLRDVWGRDVPILAQCAAAGDQSPRDRIRWGKGEPSMFEPEGAAEMARRLRHAVTDGLEAAKGRIQHKAVFAHVSQDLALPLRTVSAQETATAQAEQDAVYAKYENLSDMSGEDRMYCTFRAGILARARAQEKDPFYTFRLHVLRVGDSVWATNPFELFIAYGLRIKARSRAEYTATVQLAGDCGGYLPTAEAIGGGHYSALVSNGFVGPDGGRILVETTVREINRLFEDAGDSEREVYPKP